MNGATMKPGGGGGGVAGTQKFGSVGGASHSAGGLGSAVSMYMNGQQKTATGGSGSAAGGLGKQQQNYMSPPMGHANVHNTGGRMAPRANMLMESSSTSTTAAFTTDIKGGMELMGFGGNNVNASGTANTGDEEVMFPSLRVREEFGTETFAVPLGIVNSWEVGGFHSIMDFAAC
jgi:hypothetical protein